MLTFLAFSLAFLIPFTLSYPADIGSAEFAGVQCGQHANNTPCAINPDPLVSEIFCCSKWGWCGTSDMYCGYGNCQSGPCWNELNQPQPHSSHVVPAAPPGDSNATATETLVSQPPVLLTTQIMVVTVAPMVTVTVDPEAPVVTVTGADGSVSESTPLVTTTCTSTWSGTSLVVVTVAPTATQGSDSETPTKRRVKPGAVASTLVLQMSELPPAYNASLMNGSSSSGSSRKNNLNPWLTLVLPLLLTLIS